VDHARQRQLDCADRQLDSDRNSDLGPDFDSKPKVQTRCAWSGGTLSLGSRGLDYVKTEYLLDALGIHSRADPGPISWSLTAWSGTLANTAPLSSKPCSRTARAVTRFATRRTSRSSWLCSCWMGTSSFAWWRQKGKRKDQTSLLRSDFSPPTTTTTASFHFDDPILRRRLHPP